eukprot:TRINITY_DN27206_c0_g1_i1.p1 TRINITY_DN27206_c0_g1~~TRINITY_DN27206_c0_g1_i1.p1  ORF type:complete len:182 (+),score=42.87 TRINITY_DN27206_c0_g1_i1:253-798(+)
MGFAWLSTTTADGVCHGVLHRLRMEDFQLLADIECDYDCETVAVAAADGRSIDAGVFVSPTEKCCADGLPPPQRYVKLLADGAEQWRLDRDFISWLRGMPTIDSRQRGQEYYCRPDGTRILSTWKQKRAERERGSAPEKRRDTDGQLYTKQEFRSFYGRYAEWDRAGGAGGGGSGARRRVQ